MQYAALVVAEVGPADRAGFLLMPKLPKHNIFNV
jgi:hypothetical protein